MKLLTVNILALFLLTGCINSGDAAREIVAALEFGEDEYGTFKLTGNVDLNPLPIFSANVHLDLEKIKDAPEYVDE